MQQYTLVLCAHLYTDFNEALSLKIFYLRPCIPPDDIRLLVLDLPRDYYDDVPLSYPEPLPHFSGDSDNSSDAI